VAVLPVNQMVSWLCDVDVGGIHVRSLWLLIPLKYDVESSLYVLIFQLDPTHFDFNLHYFS
jgi:hypothetical protein